MLHRAAEASRHEAENSMRWQVTDKQFRAFSSEVDTGSRKKTRRNKKLELRSDSIGTEKAPEAVSGVHEPAGASFVACQDVAVDEERYCSLSLPDMMSK